MLCGVPACWGVEQEECLPENYVTPMKPQTHDDQNEDELNPARQGTLNPPHSGYSPAPHRSVLESGHIRYTWDTVSTALLFGWCLLITNLWPTELHVQITANCNRTIRLWCSRSASFRDQTSHLLLPLGRLETNGNPSKAWRIACNDTKSAKLS